MRYRNEILLLLSSKPHLRVEEVFAPLKERYPLMSLATVYRNLRSLERSGEVVTFLHPDGALRYEVSLPEHHQHLVCELCGMVMEIKFAFIDELSENLRQRANFHLHPHRVSIIGRCDTCT